ncbi:hypothetical protein [Nocardia sp. NPDC005366]|uniref:DUF6998 domain-containing protein n=1 Tax=Nocardia sp. NPDC005366 TaxID=3156878 RepID=UPI0033B82B5E
MRERPTIPSTASPNSFAERTARTAHLVAQLHAIVAELEALHPGRAFPLDGHLVGSLAEAAAEALFNGPLAAVASAVGRVVSNGQARLSLNRLRTLNSAVAPSDRVPPRT